MFSRLPDEILKKILTYIPKTECYKFFHINKECFNFEPKYHFKSIYWASRKKFYQLIKITCCWKNEYNLSKINIQYKFVEDLYYKLNKIYLNYYKSVSKLVCTDKQKKSFNEYFDKYIDLYMKKNIYLIKHMKKYNVEFN